MPLNAALFNRMPIDFKRELNPEQHAAVTSKPGPALVLAGAGSGKTRTLTYRVAYLIEELRVHPDAILLLTFTNKAAREMLERVEALNALRRRPQFSGTFHSICGRLLRMHGEHLGIRPDFTILDQSDAEALFTKLIKASDKLYLKNKDNPKPKRLLGLYSFARNTCEPFTDVFNAAFPWDASLGSKVGGFFNDYAAAKQQQNVMDFDDLLVYLNTLLGEVSAVREACANRFQHILVDEYQDTNTVQAQIVDRIGLHHTIMAVGDDAQCIYTWRGARFENIRQFPERHPNTQLFKILTNYRSIPPILTFANRILANQPVGSGYTKELQPHRKGHREPSIQNFYDSREQARFVAAKIEDLYHDGFNLRDIAILYRAHYQAVDLQLELTRQAIPFVITSGLKFFEQAHIKDFSAQLRILANPSDDSAIDRLLGLLPRVGPATANKILSAARKALAKAEADFAAQRDALFNDLDARPSLFSALADPAIVRKLPEDARADFSAMLESLLEAHCALQGPHPASPAKVTSILAEGWYRGFIESAYPDWRERIDDLGAMIPFAERFDSMQELLTQLVLLNGETSERAIEPDDSAVRLTTIHQAKGLEFPVVFLISAADGYLPLRRAIEEGDVEEERRLFYVAVTRAMDELYITYPLLETNRGALNRLPPSRFISELTD